MNSNRVVHGIRCAHFDVRLMHVDGRWCRLMHADDARQRINTTITPTTNRVIGWKRPC